LVELDLSCVAPRSGTRVDRDDGPLAVELGSQCGVLVVQGGDDTTGWTADIDELRRLCESPEHEVLVADLTDRFGPYGTIGLALSAITPSESVLKLLLMSCRVMSRGVGTVLLDHVVGRAWPRAGNRWRSSCRPT
jgi:hypothetical protein